MNRAAMVAICAMALMNAGCAVEGGLGEPGETAGGEPSVADAAAARGTTQGAFLGANLVEDR